MVIGRGLSTGGSYGRIEAVITSIQYGWSNFDSWCCIKNIDPIELSAYRFYNLAIRYLQEDKSAEQLIALENSLVECDAIKHPLRELSLKYRKDVGQNSTEEPERSVERQRYIPPWYHGEEAAFQTAKLAQAGINALPKMG